MNRNPITHDSARRPSRKKYDYKSGRGRTQCEATCSPSHIDDHMPPCMQIAQIATMQSGPHEYEHGGYDGGWIVEQIGQSLASRTVRRRRASRFASSRDVGWCARSPARGRVCASLLWSSRVETALQSTLGRTLADELGLLDSSGRVLHQLLLVIYRTPEKRDCAIILRLRYTTRLMDSGLTDDAHVLLGKVDNLCRSRNANKHQSLVLTR